MPFIQLKEPSNSTKHRLEDIQWDSKVSDIKLKAFEVVNIPATEQHLIFSGKILNDDKALANYGIVDGCTVYVVRKRLKPKSIEQEPSRESVENVMEVLEAAIRSPSYRKTIEKILDNPEMMEQLIVATPGLSEDLTAMALLQDQELLKQVIETADIEKLVKQHPCLVEAASYIAAATASEGGGEHRAARLRNFGTDNDEDMPDLEPGVMARAEMIAAQEESIQNTQGSRARRQQVTSSMLASALASAGLPTPPPTSEVGQGPSTSRSSMQQISRNMITEAIAGALGGSGSSSSSSNEGSTAQNLQTQLQLLRDMGITDDEVSLRALRATGGNVQAALEFIFGGT